MPVDQPPMDAIVVAEIVVDARGLRCPWPVLRLDRALRDGASVVELLCDDPAAAGEVTAYARERGFVVAVVPGGFRVAR